MTISENDPPKRPQTLENLSSESTLHEKAQKAFKRISSIPVFYPKRWYADLYETKGKKTVYKLKNSKVLKYMYRRASKSELCLVAEIEYLILDYTFPTKKEFCQLAKRVRNEVLEKIVTMYSSGPLGKEINQFPSHPLEKTFRSSDAYVKYSENLVKVYNISKILYFVLYDRYDSIIQADQKAEEYDEEFISSLAEDKYPLFLNYEKVLSNGWKKEELIAIDHLILDGLNSNTNLHKLFTEDPAFRYDVQDFLQPYFSIIITSPLKSLRGGSTSFCVF